MTVLVGSATGVDSATVPAHSAGDLLIVHAFATSAIIPTMPAGWTSIQSGTSSNVGSIVAYKVATSNAEVTGTWTGATDLSVQVWNGASGIGASAVATGTNAAAVSYPALTGVRALGSVIVAYIGIRANNLAAETPPTGMTFRAGRTSSLGEIAAHDTNGYASAWSAQSVNTGAGTIRSRTIVIEILSQAATVSLTDNADSIAASAYQPVATITITDNDDYVRARVRTDTLDKSAEAFFLSARSDVMPIDLIEISHPSFSKVYRFTPTLADGVEVRIDGVDRSFDYYPARVTRMGVSSNLDDGMQIDFGDLGEVLPLEIDRVASASSYNVKPTVKYYLFRSDNLNAALIGPLIFEAGNIAFNWSGASFEAKAPTINMNRTGEFYDLETYPMLRGFL